MKRDRILIITIVILILLNITVISVMWFGKPHGERQTPRPARIAEKFMISELGLDQEQTKEFTTLKKQHEQKIRGVHNELKQLRKELYMGLKADQVDSTKVAVLTQTIGNKHQEMERLIFDHFLAIKSICTEEQATKLEQILQRTVDRRMGKRKFRRPNRE